MDNTFYCEVIIPHGVFPPGVYSFKVDSRFGTFSKHRRLLEISHYAWKETDQGVFWLKNRTRATPDVLTEDELVEFMWIKLKAKSLPS